VNLSGSDQATASAPRHAEGEKTPTMADRPLVSIVTPSYNHALYIRQTINSVLEQDYPWTEHIVIDGGSTDGTVDILGEYGKRHPDRFRWVSEPDRGQSHAFNKGLALARGDIIGWQNSDDYYLPGAFSEAVRLFAQQPDVSVIYGDCRLVDGNGAYAGAWPTGPFDWNRLLYSCFILNQATFFRKEALLAAGGLTEDLHQAMDFDLYLRLSLTHRFRYCPGFRGVYRLLPTAKTSTGIVRNRLECIRAVESLLTSPHLPDSRIATVRQATLVHVQEAIIASLAEDRRDVALELLRKSYLLDPGFDQWRSLCRRLVMRRVMTTQWFGIVSYAKTLSIPKDLLELADEDRKLTRLATVQLVAVAELFHSLAQPSRSARASYLIAALRRDQGLSRYPGSSVAAARLLFGDGFVDRLNPMFTWVRSLMDYKASGKAGRWVQRFERIGDDG
jgi:GT2 family glycosyltransferase